MTKCTSRKWDTVLWIYIPQQQNLHKCAFRNIRKPMVFVLLYFYSSCIQQQRLHINMIQCTSTKTENLHYFLYFEWVSSRKIAHKCVHPGLHTLCQKVNRNMHTIILLSSWTSLYNSAESYKQLQCDINIHYSNNFQQHFLRFLQYRTSCRRHST